MRLINQANLATIKVMFATTIFSATQCYNIVASCDIVSDGYNIGPALQRHVALEIVVANRPV